MKTKSQDTQANPICSICIANYNGATVLADCLDSVMSQKDAPSFEIIVHDDASTDDSVKLLRTHYPQVIIVESKNNVGFFISNNRMVERARGDFILLLNNDAALHEDAIASLYDHAMIQRPQGILTPPQYDWRTGKLVDRGCFLDPFYNPIPNLSADRNDVAMVIGACLWLPRELWHKIGGFPEWMVSIAEDMYLCCVARLFGYPVQVTRSSGYRHWQGMNFSGRQTECSLLVSTYKRRILSERNKTITMLIASPASLLSVVFPSHIILLGIEGAVTSLFTKNRKLFTEVYLQLPFLILNVRRKILFFRRRIQKNRVVGCSFFLSKFRLVPRKLILLLQFGLPEVN